MIHDYDKIADGRLSSAIFMLIIAGIFFLALYLYKRAEEEQ